MLCRSVSHLSCADHRQPPRARFYDSLDCQCWHGRLKGLSAPFSYFCRVCHVTVSPCLPSQECPVWLFTCDTFQVNAISIKIHQLSKPLQQATTNILREVLTFLAFARHSYPFLPDCGFPPTLVNAKDEQTNIVCNACGTANALTKSRMRRMTKVSRAMGSQENYVGDDCH